ncbi:F-box protein [Candidatus Paracaedibacter acanthamoebae]|nr:F-box protein [Candidatus Paracaedibacter acanthamoebae]
MEIMLEIFKKLSLSDIVQSSQACWEWRILSEEPQLWKTVRQTIHGDYSESEATKENAKRHWLRIVVNTLSDLEKIEYLVTKYQLNNGHPFEGYKNLPLFRAEVPILRIKERAAQGYEVAIEAVIKWRMEGINTKEGEIIEKNPQAAFEFNEHLVMQRNEKALMRKIEGLAHGRWGYDKDPKAAFKLNEYLVGQGSETAINRKIEGYARGWWGYHKNPKSAFKLNERLVGQGSETAISRKIEGYARGWWGYHKNPKVAFEFNERLVGQDNEKALMRKIEGLAHGRWGYDKDPKAAATLIDYLATQGNEWAIEQKIFGLCGYNNDDSTYQPAANPKAAVEFNERLVKQGNERAFIRKIEGLNKGLSGYKRDPKAAFDLNEGLVKQGKQAAIIRKIENLKSREASHYKRFKGMPNLKDWIEKEALKGSRWARYLKAQGLKYGTFGFKMNRALAIKYIRNHGIPY